MRCDRIGPDLARYRELSPQRREQVDRHLACCPACTERLASYSAQDQTLGALPMLRPAPGWLERVRAAAQPGRRFSTGLTVTQRALALATALALLLGASLTVSATALPGDLLYSLKRAQEALRLHLTVGEDAESALREALQAQRRQEAGRLIQAGRAAQVEFEGQVERRDDGVWLISGLPVRLRDVDGASLAAGDWVAVHGRTVGGVVEAHQVRVLTRAHPHPTPHTPTPAAGQRAQQRGQPDSSGTGPAQSPDHTPARQGSAAPHGSTKPAATVAPQGAATAAPTPGATPAAEAPSPTAPSQPPPNPPPGSGPGPGAPAVTPPGSGLGSGGRGAASPTLGGARRGP